MPRRTQSLDDPSALATSGYGTANLMPKDTKRRAGPVAIAPRPSAQQPYGQPPQAPSEKQRVGFDPDTGTVIPWNGQVTRTPAGPPGPGMRPNQNKLSKWTDEELSKLVRMKLDGETLEYMEDKLTGRSKHAISEKFKKLDRASQVPTGLVLKGASGDSIEAPERSYFDVWQRKRDDQDEGDGDDGGGSGNAQYGLNPAESQSGGLSFINTFG